MIGGTIVSTLLTLFVVPCAYSLMARLESRRKEARMREVMTTMGEKAEGVEAPAGAEEVRA